MSHSLVKNHIHLIYGTKNREPWLTDDVRAGLFAYQAGILKNWDSPAIVIGGVEDHVHALFTLSKNHSLKDVVEEVKKSSSRWVKTNAGIGEFYWQAGYAGFSTSESQIPNVRRYIENQAEHHRMTTFQDELRALLRRHGMEVDERYAWD